MAGKNEMPPAANDLEAMGRPRRAAPVAMELEDEDEAGWCDSSGRCEAREELEPAVHGGGE